MYLLDVLTIGVTTQCNAFLLLTIYLTTQIVGTASRENIPDVPMFNATPAKRPRRQALSETLVEVGQTIASALTPGAPPANEALPALEPDVPIEQVFVVFLTFTELYRKS